MKTRFSTCLTIHCVPLLANGCGTSNPTGTNATTVESAVEWINHDAIQYNVTSKSVPSKFASKTFGEGGAFQIKVTKPGGDPLRVHAVSNNDERSDRSGDLN
jgi:hypothetical protein